MKTTIKTRSLMLLCMCMMAFTACEKEETETSDMEWHVNEGAAMTMKNDVVMSDMDNFIELSLKMEEMRLQFIRFCSNDYDGELLCGPGSKSDPTEMYRLLEEILDKKDQYLTAVKRLEDQGIFDQVTTRGVVAATWDMVVNGWGGTAKNREQQLIDVLNKSNIMGNAAMMQDLFNNTEHKKGETDYKKWFTNLINGEYTNACPRIYEEWYNNTNEGVGMRAFFDYVEDHKSGNGNPIWQDAANVGIEQALKAANFNVAIWDTATGGYVGKWQDVNTIIEESNRLRDKINKGTATTGDYRRFLAGVGGVWTKEKLGEFFGKDLKIESKVFDTVWGESYDYLTDKAMQKDEDEKTLKDNDEAFIFVENNVSDKSSKPAIVIVKDEKGSTTVAPTDKDGNAKIPNKPGKKTITTVTKDGKRSTQKADVKAGDNEMKAQPELDNVNFDIEIDPSELVLVANPDIEFIDVYTMYNYFAVKSDQKWLKVSFNARTIFVEAEENTTKDVRKATITIGFSQNGKDLLKTATVSVTQLAPVETDLSFINFKKFRITGMEALSGTQTENHKWITQIEKSFVFANDKLEIQHLSDDECVVSGSYSNKQQYGQPEDVYPTLDILPDKPYGLHYEFSFHVKALDPNEFFTQNNFCITNFQITGHSKKTISVGAGNYGDDFVNFKWTVKDIYLDIDNDGYNGKSGAYMTFMGYDYTRTTKFQYQATRQYCDREHTTWSTYDPSIGEKPELIYAESLVDRYKTDEDKTGYNHCDFRLRWD